MSSQIKQEAGLCKEENSSQWPCLIADEKSQKGWNSGHWSQQQNTKCIAFFQYNRPELNSKLKRKENKLFKQMSMFIESRSPIQCRSQCYKLLRKYKTFFSIILNFKKNFTQKEFNDIYENLSKNPLIKFKGQKQMTLKEQKDSHMKDVLTQTDKSYLFKRYSKSQTDRETSKSKSAEENNFPFMKAGWWL